MKTLPCTCNGSGIDCHYTEHTVWTGRMIDLDTMSADGWKIADMRATLHPVGESKWVTAFLVRSPRDVTPAKATPKKDVLCCAECDTPVTYTDDGGFHCEPCGYSPSMQDTYFRA